MDEFRDSSVNNDPTKVGTSIHNEDLNFSNNMDSTIDNMNPLNPMFDYKWADVDDMKTARMSAS